MVDRTVGRYALFALLFILVGTARAENTHEPLTFDWIFSEEGKTAAALPSYTWLEDGRVLLYDEYPPEAERTIESFDPATGKRVTVIDRNKVIAAFTAFLEPEEPIEEPGWPTAFHPGGQQACYLLDGDLYLLDFASSAVTRATDTAAEEKSPRYSPDGKHLAFVRANDLWVIALASGDETRLTTGGTDTLLNGTVSWVYWEEVFGRIDRGFEWSPNSDAIAFLQTDESPVGLMHYVDFKPNLPKVVEQRYPKTGEPNPRVRAGVVDLAEQKTTWIDLGVYPYEYLARLHWLPGGKRLAVQTMNRAQTTVDLFLADRASGAVTHVLRETDDGWVNLHDDLFFLTRSDGFLWRSERDGWAHLYRFGPDGKPDGRVTEGEWSLRSSGGVFWLRQAIASVDEAGRWVYFTALEKSSVERHLYRIRLDGSKMERLTEEDGVHRILFSPDGRYYLDAHSAFDAAPSLTLHAAAGKLLHTITAPRTERLEPFDLLIPELLTVSTRDGFAMPAQLLKPRGFKKGKQYPAVVYVYGGPSAPTISNTFQSGARAMFEQLLANAGFVVFRVDNRCATGISKTLENTYEGYGDAELRDLVDGVQWLKSRSWVDGDRMGIWGWSGGGSFTLLALTGSKEFRAGIAVAAVSDWDYYDTKWAEAFMKRPQDNEAGYAATSHADRAAELHGRLMLVHGTYDDNVNPQNAWRMVDELVDAGLTFDMMIYPMRKHGIRDDAAQEHLYRTMLEFWHRNLTP